MASPQPDKFTKISSELLDALCFLQLSGSEWSFVHALIRKTYGYNKKEDWITNTQIMSMTGLCKERVSEARTKLLGLNIITENGNKIGVQKDYEKWGKLRKNVTKVTEKRNYQLRKNVTTIDSIDNRQLGANAPVIKSLVMWNRNTEEDVVDYDGDGSLKAEKKPQTKKYPNAPVVQKVFQEVLGKNPANWKLNTTQLQACENLYTERTPERVRAALHYFQEVKDQEFCPMISSPYDLDSKWQKLADFKNRVWTLTNS